MQIRYFEFRSSLTAPATFFWEITVFTYSYIVREGSIETAGKKQFQEFEDSKICEAAVEQAIRAQLQLGYRETGADSSSQTSGAQKREQPQPQHREQRSEARDPLAKPQIPQADELNQVVGKDLRTINLRNLIAQDPNASQALREIFGQPDPPEPQPQTVAEDMDAAMTQEDSTDETAEASTRLDEPIAINLARLAAQANRESEAVASIAADPTIDTDTANSQHLPETLTIAEQEALEAATDRDRLRHLAYESPRLASLVAQNPTADQELLRELAALGQPEVEKQVLTNPNIPPDLFRDLAAKYPQHLWRNPALYLLLLESPDLFLGRMASTLKGLVRRGRIPEIALETLTRSQDESLQLVIAMNLHTPTPLLRQLYESSSQAVQEAVQLHVNWTELLDSAWIEATQGKIDNLIGQAKQSYNDTLAQIVSLPTIESYFSQGHLHAIRSQSRISYSVSVEQLAEMAQSPDWQQYQTAARHPDTPVHILEELFNNSEKDLALTHLASNPSTPPELLEKLADRTNGYGDIGREVAANPSTPVSLLEKLADSNFHNAVHQGVACNPMTPPFLLERLAHKPNMAGYVYATIAQNPNTPVRVLEYLVQADNARAPQWLAVIANNPKTPKNLVLQILSKFEAMGHFSLTVGQASWPNNLLVSPRFLEVLLHKAEEDLKTGWHKQHKDSAISQMVAIARHPHTPESVLRQLLLETEEHSIRLAIAANPQTPQYLYEIWGLKILESASSYQFQGFFRAGGSEHSCT